MKLLLKFIILLLINTLCINYASAQTSLAEINSVKKNEINIPPLNVIINSVLKRNAMVRFRKQGIQSKESNVKSEKIYWTRNLGLQADSRYGTFDNTILNSDGGTSGSLINTNTRQWNYGVGLYLKLPLFDFLNRKNQVEQANLELDEAKSMLQFQEDEIRQNTIKLYQDLLLKQKLLNLTSQNLGNVKVNMEMVEKEFRNGIIPVSEYVRLSDVSSRVESDYEVAKSNFFLAKKLLEDVAGFSFGIITN